MRDSRRRLTFLQEGVIERLRARGFMDVADAAHAAWSNGHRLETPEVLRIGGPALLRDFERANEQARVIT